MSAQSRRILFSSLQEPTSSPPLRAPHPKRRTLPQVLSLITNFNKKRTHGSFSTTAKFCFCFLSSMEQCLLSKKTQKTRLLLGAPVAGVSLLLDRVVSSSTFFVALCPFLWTFSRPVPNHTTAVTFRSQLQLLHFRAELTRRRS